MLKCIYIKGLRYEGESEEKAQKRERLMEENNLRVDALWKDWERQRKTPMSSMREWATKHGLLP